MIILIGIVIPSHSNCNVTLHWSYIDFVVYLMESCVLSLNICRSNHIFLFFFKRESHTTIVWINNANVCRIFSTSLVNRKHQKYASLKVNIPRKIRGNFHNPLVITKKNIKKGKVYVKNEKKNIFFEFVIPCLVWGLFTSRVR